MGGAQGNADGSFPFPGRFVSSGGRFIVWNSFASNLVTGDTNNTWDIFLFDRDLRTTERVNVDSNGGQANGITGVYGFSISPDGRYVVFESAASNLVFGDTNGAREVFLRDRQTASTERVSLTSTGSQANGPSFYPTISDDGRFVAFTSLANNMAPNDTNGSWDVFVRDRWASTTQRVSLSSAGLQVVGDSYKGEISASGQFVAFASTASGLVHGDTNGTWNVFLRDLAQGTTDLVDVSLLGGPGNGAAEYWGLSADGRFVLFRSDSSDLIPSDQNGASDLFVRDRWLGVTSIVDVTPSGLPAAQGCSYGTISADGRYVEFLSNSPDLVAGDTNAAGDIFVRDLVSHSTERETVRTDGSQVSLGGGGGSISADGSCVVFLSDATDIVSGDTNGHTDVFLRDRFYTHFTSLCEPGQGGVVDCPCANPPSGSGRGCDNSAGTGGAVLAASGSCHLATDSLCFTTGAELAHATSILLQSTSTTPTGVAFGQGVRCTAGLMKRLFVKSAVNGSITAPDFAAGDSTISARSSAVGDVIHAGENRFYLVYYRDPVVLGGCWAGGTFNCTQTGQILWWP